MKILPLTLAALAMTQLAANAQFECLTPSEQDAILKTKLSELPKTVKNHLDHTNPAKNRDGAVLAKRVAIDSADKKDIGSFGWYSVPAMSDIQRLSDIYPVDGTPYGTVAIVAAKDEYEPGAFMVYPFENLGKVKFSLSPFKNAKGEVFPAADLDLKVIKSWYQNKNGWYSYFGDTDFKLCPELLLNDEDIIRVDESKKANYARITGRDGKQFEKWINPPREMDITFFDHYRTYSTFPSMAPGFKDAETLQPVLLEEGAFKAFYLTARTTEKTPEGLYKGTVNLTDTKGKALGSIPVAVRVLPFTLPAPKTFVNPDVDFMISSYSYISLEILRAYNGGDNELAKKQLVEVLRNQVEHGQNMHWVRSSGNGPTTELLVTIDAMKKAGMRTDAIVGGPSPKNSSTVEMEAHAKQLASYFDKEFGHHNFYMGYGDEPGAKWVENARPLFKAYQKYGLKFIIAGGDTVFNKAGYAYDWFNMAKDPIDDSSTRLWNFVGDNQSAWYACMHVGPENPAYNRRQYGLTPYFSGYTAFCNYAHHFGPYNDDRTTYKPMVFAYGTEDGVIDTVQWEGFREGIDDIRYATLMRKLAKKAAASDNIDTRYLGKKALQFFALFKKESDDLNEARLEMIRYIMEMNDRGIN